MTTILKHNYWTIILPQFLHRIHRKLLQLSLTPPTISDSPFPDIATIFVDVNGVLNLLIELDISKAPRPDKISAHFLKLRSTEIAPILTLIFQASIHKSRVPPDWKQANIVPIFKKGDRTPLQQL